MASQYDKIKTAKELIVEVSMHGLSTAQDDICRAQDIFGHSSIEELVALANDNGRNDENGNPDMNGTWCKGRKGTQELFYSVLFHIWNWREATAFYNEHSNPDNIKELKEEILRQTRTIEETKKHFNLINGDLVKEQVETSNLRKQLVEAKDEKKALEDEIIILKAKMYDLLIGGENKYFVSFANHEREAYDFLLRLTKEQAHEPTEPKETEVK